MLIHAYVDEQTGAGSGVWTWLRPHRVKRLVGDSQGLWRWVRFVETCGRTRRSKPVPTLELGPACRDWAPTPIHAYGSKAGWSWLRWGA